MPVVAVSDRFSETAPPGATDPEDRARTSAAANAAVSEMTDRNVVRRKPQNEPFKRMNDLRMLPAKQT